MIPADFLESLPRGARIAIILTFAVLVHFIGRGLRKIAQWMLTPKPQEGLSRKESFARLYPKLATLMTILINALVFTIYFVAVGLILREFDVKLTAYLASASVIGLAIGFGSQGLVQDVVIGLTLIFSNAFNIGNVVEISGQIGRVESIGLRFTTLINLNGQKIYIPNRTIGIMGRYHNGYIRAYVDLEIPATGERDTITEEAISIANAMHSQYRSVILTNPEVYPLKTVEGEKWQYLRLKFRLWPGQTTVLETVFKQRVLSSIKRVAPNYADWMITITYGVE